MSANPPPRSPRTVAPEDGINEILSILFGRNTVAKKLRFAKGKRSNVDTIYCFVVPLNSHTLHNSTTEFFFLIKRLRKCYIITIFLLCTQTHFASSNPILTFPPTAP
jgi:hypothetical protein